jgi:hypothetical protein
MLPHLLMRGVGVRLVNKALALRQGAFLPNSQTFVELFPQVISTLGLLIDFFS